MVCRSIRMALLIGAISVAVSSARADDKVGGTTGPCMRTIQVTECVPETYKVKRTAYKVECKTEEYDAWRCESVPETRERTVTCVKRVPVTKTETRKCAQTVTEYCDKVVMKKSWQTVQETVMVKKLVRLGHWECREVEPLFAGLFHKGGCCNPCDPCATNCCTPTRTKKVWVHCPEYQCCPKTVCKKVCVECPTVCKVPVCKTVWTEKQVQVCTYECVTEQRTVKETVCVTRKVPVKATRTVRVCVPYEEEVTCTRMVARTVERQVAVADACCNPCGNTCATTCCSSRGHGFDFGHRLRGHGNCCR